MKKSDDKMVKLNHDTMSLQFLGSTQYTGTGCAKVKTHGYKHSLNINTIQRNAKHSLLSFSFLQLQGATVDHLQNIRRT